MNRYEGCKFVEFLQNDKDETPIRKGIVQAVPRVGEYVQWRGLAGVWQVTMIVHGFPQDKPEERSADIFVYMKYLRRFPNP